MSELMQKTWQVSRDELIDGSATPLCYLSTGELEAAYRIAKADSSDAGQHAAAVIRRELIKRAIPPTA